jgi:NAD(P)-dependent dehydrogenase (short-subunit alcohol dehydrogenase family)
VLDVKAAIVTGGASGIGMGISLSLATNGADVIVADVREEQPEGGLKTFDGIREGTGSVERKRCTESLAGD